MAEAQYRILSDIHYGDRASAVTSLAQLAPLTAGVEVLIANGDTTDNRPGPDPELLAANAQDIAAFVRTAPAEVRLLTGNHDPAISPEHRLDLPGGILVTHGDLLFDDIVPWSEDSSAARDLVMTARRRPTPPGTELDHLLAAHREAAARLPRRAGAALHGARNPVGLVRDALALAPRALRIFQAWQETPARGAALLARHRPSARFLILGHTHRPGYWRRRDGRVIINTGSLCPPSGRLVVDVTPEELLIRRVEQRRGDYHPGRVVARFALTSPHLPAKPSP